MPGKKKGEVLQTLPSLKKSWKKVILENQEHFMERLNKHNREMNEKIEEEVAKRLGDYVHRIESALDGTIAIKEMLIEKGFIRREEYTQRRDKTREK